MKNRISMLTFLGVLLTGYSLAQVQTDCSTSGTSSGGQVNATTNCTSTDTGAAQAERNRQNAEAGQAMGNTLGTGLAAIMLQHKEKKELKKEQMQLEAYCDQHQGELWSWQVNGQKLSGTCPGDITQNAGLKQYCAAHPGEGWENKNSSGVILHSGTCPGQMRFDVARRLFTGSLQAEFAKAGVAGYAKFDGDVLTVHSERASLMRFHGITSDEKFLPWFRTMNVKTYIYTNDADKTFKFDVANNREVTTDTTAVAGTPQTVSTPTMATPAATVAPVAPPH